MTSVVAGVILAGGLSRRMGGGDKPLLSLAGKPMIGHVIDRLGPQCEAVAINANGDPKRFNSFGYPVFPDSIGDFSGPLAGVLSGMEWAAENGNFTHVVTAAADTPFLPEDLVAKLLEAAGGSQDTIVLASSNDRRHPVFGLWPVALRDDLRSWMQSTDTFKVLAWVDRHANAKVDFPMTRIGNEVVDPFFNANTPDDMERAEQMISVGIE